VTWRDAGWPRALGLVVLLLSASCARRIAPVTVAIGASEPAETSPPASSWARRCAQGMTALAGGSFALGATKTSVVVRPFCIDTTEVTVAAYDWCVRSGGCQAPASMVDDSAYASEAERLTWDACNGGRAERADHPVNCVSWEESAVYCRTIGKRLPTEEEWEWAARGGNEGRIYAWGSARPERQACWSGIEKRHGTCPVGRFPEGDAPGGIHDLTGNVNEWTSSGDAEGKVIRGGAWGYLEMAYLRVDHALSIDPTIRSRAVGFRCAR
jgi:formylglycine-generating enzyme required for sulfatase activity